MIREILSNTRTWLIGATVALATTALHAQATTYCFKQSGSLCSLLEAQNVASGSCGSGVVTEIDITIYPCNGSTSFESGTILRCSDSTEAIYLFPFGGFHVFYPVNGGNWGAVGGGLCSYYAYFAW